MIKLSEKTTKTCLHSNTRFTQDNDKQEMGKSKNRKHYITEQVYLNWDCYRGSSGCDAIILVLNGILSKRRNEVDDSLFADNLVIYTRRIVRDATRASEATRNYVKKLDNPLLQGEHSATGDDTGLD